MALTGCGWCAKKSEAVSVGLRWHESCECKPNDVRNEMSAGLVARMYGGPGDVSYIPELTKLNMT